MNNKEIRVFGIKRSGNHAIINWIFYQISGKVVFLNNCYPQGQSIKTYEGVGRIDCKGINYWDFKTKFWFFEKNPFHNKNIVTYSKKDKRFNQKKLQESFKDAVIVSFEGKNIQQMNALLDDYHDELMGKSNEIFYIIILRDPFNLLASIYKKWGKEHLPMAVDMWQEYAQTFIEYEKARDNHFLGISYNRWLIDIEYRKKITEKLRINFDDSALDIVANFGGGSSFDSLSHDKNAKSMDVLNRWKTLQEDAEFRSFFKNSNLIELSESIFGILPDTEKLLSS